MRCLYCAHENLDTAQICENCGASLQELRWGARPLESKRGPLKLMLYVRGGGSKTPLIFKLDKPLVIGRVDDEEPQPEPPDIDLTSHNAYDKGVSRRHVQIVPKADTITLEDMNSKNGTFLNGQRLVPHQPRILRDGDDIRLGTLVLYVRYKHGDEPI